MAHVRTPRKRIRLSVLPFRRLLLLTIALGLTGCVYLRLLEVKSQLQDFDRNFRVEIKDQWYVQFLHPVMLSGDFTYLTELEPTRIERLADGERWIVDFHKLDRSDRIVIPRKTLTFTMQFNREDKLSRFGFSPLFLSIAPPAFLEASIRSMGKGSVDTGHRQLRVDPQDLPQIKAQLPTRQSIIATFGPPLLETREDQEQHAFYRFIADTRPVHGNPGANRLAEVRVSFDSATGELTRMMGKFVGLKLRINYRALLAPTEPRSTKHKEPHHPAASEAR
jgi:hypothetical protein